MNNTDTRNWTLINSHKISSVIDCQLSLTITNSQQLLRIFTNSTLFSITLINPYQLSSTLINVRQLSPPLTYIHLDCLLGVKKLYQRWPKIWECLPMNSTADQYWCSFQESAMCTVDAFALIFVNICQHSR